MEKYVSKYTLNNENIFEVFNNTIYKSLFKNYKEHWDNFVIVYVYVINYKVTGLSKVVEITFILFFDFVDQWYPTKYFSYKLQWIL